LIIDNYAVGLGDFLGELGELDDLDVLEYLDDLEDLDGLDDLGFFDRVCLGCSLAVVGFAGWEI